MHAAYRKPSYNIAYATSYFEAKNDNLIRCDWKSLRKQLLLQWTRLTKKELDAAGQDCEKIALLVQRKYGVASDLVENYLANLARTLPVRM